MTTLYTQLQDDIRKVVIETLTEFPNPIVIFANEGGTEPATSYCTISILSLEQVGRSQEASQSVTDDDVSITSQAPFEITALISFVGSNAGNMAYSSHGRISNSLLAREAAQSSSIALMRKSSTRRVPYYRETKWVDVFSYNATFFFIGGITDVIPLIKQVVIENVDTSELINIPETI